MVRINGTGAKADNNRLQPHEQKCSERWRCQAFWDRRMACARRVNDSEKAGTGPWGGRRSPLPCDSEVINRLIEKDNEARCASEGTVTTFLRIRIDRLACLSPNGAALERRPRNVKFKLPLTLSALRRLLLVP